MTAGHTSSRVGLGLAMALWVSGCGATETVQGFPPKFAGVGLELRIDGDTPVVVQALPGGPSAIAGVQRGDVVLAIDGESTRGQSLGDVVMRLRGEPDTQTSLTMQRGKDRIIVVVRRKIMQKTGDKYRPVAGQ